MGKSMHNSILPRSAIAAVNHNEKIRIYFQTYNGQLREIYSNDGATYHCSPCLPTPEGQKAFTPLSAVTYSEGREIRLYYLTRDSVIQELCYSGDGWYPGELNHLRIRTAPYSKLAAVFCERLGHRVYYQRDLDNKIVEVLMDFIGGGGWRIGAALSEALPGSALTAYCHSPGDSPIWVYFQAQDLSTREIVSYNWRDEKVIHIGRTTPHSSLSVINLGGNSVNLRLYLQARFGDTVGELAKCGGQGTIWSEFRQLRYAVQLTPLAAVSWDNGKEIRVYFQGDGDDISEEKLSGGMDWRAGHKIPTI
ncbi:fucose-specific lectin [Kalaharituber pfeilii]|nr:fucose-specific lectin [Kalaharituber pfeilii]